MSCGGCLKRNPKTDSDFCEMCLEMPHPEEFECILGNGEYIPNYRCDTGCLANPTCGVCEYDVKYSPLSLIKDGYYVMQDCEQFVWDLSQCVVKYVRKQIIICSNDPN